MSSHDCSRLVQQGRFHIRCGKKVSLFYISGRTIYGRCNDCRAPTVNFASWQTYPSYDAAMAELTKRCL